MAKSDQKEAKTFQEKLKEALLKFDLKSFKKWVEKYNKPLWKQFKIQPEKIQMATMCKMICNRTDTLSTEAHKKAVEWLKKNGYMRGQLF